MNNAPRHLRFMWRDGVFVPEGLRMAAYCNDTFGEGEIVTFERHEDRSDASHRHYFATIAEAWRTLPESDNRFPTPEALRKWALIRSGYHTTSDVVLASEEDARTVAAFMGTSEGTLIVVRGNVVRRYVAKSQSVKAMNKQEFQKSKTDVLDTIAELLAVKRRQLEEAGARA